MLNQILLNFTVGKVFIFDKIFVLCDFEQLTFSKFKYVPLK